MEFLDFGMRVSDPWFVEKEESWTHSNDYNFFLSAQIKF